MNRRMMLIALFTVSVATSGAAVGQAADHGHAGTASNHVHAGTAAHAASHTAKGTVKRIDANKGTVRLDHGPIATLKWPAMSMDFQVADRKMLDTLKPGDAVEFEFTENPKGRYVITHVKG